MIIIIALDRVLLITKRYIYKKYITIKHLYCITIFAQFLNLTLAINLVMEGEYLEEISFVVRYNTLITGEVLFIIITIVAYMYLFYFVRLKSQEIANARHGRIDFDKKLMMSIIYTYICLLVFTCPYFVEKVSCSIFPVVDSLMERNMQFWGAILVYSNSYANACIIFYNSRLKF